MHGANYRCVVCNLSHLDSLSTRFNSWLVKTENVTGEKFVDNNECPSGSHMPYLVLVYEVKYGSEAGKIEVILLKGVANES